MKKYTSLQSHNCNSKYQPIRQAGQINGIFSKIFNR